MRKPRTVEQYDISLREAIEEACFTGHFSTTFPTASAARSYRTRIYACIQAMAREHSAAPSFLDSPYPYADYAQMLILLLRPNSKSDPCTLHLCLPNHQPEWDYETMCRLNQNNPKFDPNTAKPYTPFNIELFNEARKRRTEGRMPLAAASTDVTIPSPYLKGEMMTVDKDSSFAQKYAAHRAAGLPDSAFDPLNWHKPTQSSAVPSEPEATTAPPDRITALVQSAHPGEEVTEHPASRFHSSKL